MAKRFPDMETFDVRVGENMWRTSTLYRNTDGRGWCEYFNFHDAEGNPSFHAYNHGCLYHDSHKRAMHSVYHDEYREA